jgi:glycosyltransferase involved in cell wall biosynthesis
VRVLFLARNMHLGGAERAFLLYVNALEACHPVVVLLKKEGQLLGDLRTDVPAFYLAAPPPGAADRGRVHQMATLIRECRGLRAIVDRTGARVVSSFLMRSHIVALLTKLLWRLPLRVVLNQHEHLTESARYLYPTWLDRALMRVIARYLFRRADRIVAVAEGVKWDLVTRFGLPAERIVVVHNPIDTQALARRAREPVPGWGRGLGAGGHWALAVGRLVELKGYASLIEGFARLPATLEAHLAIIGAGPERARLEAVIERLGLVGRVRLLGSQENPWSYMAAADVLVLSSLTEAFPNVLGEAMALGVPVLSTDCGAGVREYLEDGRCGLLVPPADPGALADGLRRLFTDPALRRRLVEQGRRRVAALDVRLAVPAYQRVLEEVLRR